MKYQKEVHTIPYQQPLDRFARIPETVAGFLLESADIAPVYGRQSLMSMDPPVEVIGRDETFTIRALNHHGQILLQQFPDELFEFASNLQRTQTEISGTVQRQMNLLSESERQQQTNVASVIRVLLDFCATRDPYVGLYGAFSYDFVRLFEDLPDLHPHSDTPDFHLYIPDLVYVFNHLKETAELHYFNFSNTPLVQRLEEIPEQDALQQFSIGDIEASSDQALFETSVAQAKEYMRQGDIFEVVLSRQFTTEFKGSTLEVYKRYRTANPSPYMFYFRFGAGDDQQTLLGASPEMFVRVENGVVATRPISGTATRSEDPIQDYEHMLQLLNNPKEKSELDMLIDLARNDLARVCKPGITVQDYRYVEKYSRVMHTIAHVEGTLDNERYTAFDAFIACLNAGTLTGAPKIRAMEIIEEIEPQRRGYYGGNVGYLTFTNELNTGIIIRSAVITRNQFTTQAGATLLYDSVPAAEFAETNHKSSAILSILQ